MVAILAFRALRPFFCTTQNKNKRWQIAALWKLRILRQPWISGAHETPVRLARGRSFHGETQLSTSGFPCGLCELRRLRYALPCFCPFIQVLRFLGTGFLKQVLMDAAVGIDFGTSFHISAAICCGCWLKLSFCFIKALLAPQRNRGPAENFPPQPQFFRRYNSSCLSIE